MGKRVYAHVVASLGAVLVFVGAFLAVFGLPPMLSETIASNSTWAPILAVVGVLVGVVAAVLSYLATLRTYARTKS